jgi:hypothetical protein
MVFVIAGISMLVLTFFAFINDRRKTRAIKRSLLESQLIVLANTIFEDLCNPLMPRLRYRFNGKTNEIDIWKKDIDGRGPAQGYTICNGRYHISFNWFDPRDNRKEATVIVTISKGTAIVYERICHKKL